MLSQILGRSGRSLKPLGPTIAIGLLPMSTSTTSSKVPSYTVERYEPSYQEWPYSDRDFERSDTSSDSNFYRQPRFVTHIDDGAISALRQYYEHNLPRRGRILELCSSWISHLPKTHEDAVQREELGIVGLGMNRSELERNPFLRTSNASGGIVVQDLNQNPELGPEVHQNIDFDAVLCVVSVDYLTQPVKVLRSARSLTKSNGTIHLAISNRCFPTKVVRRWLQVGEDERLKMVADYLWFAGWREVEISVLVRGEAGWLRGQDPLWVVRGRNPS